MNLEEFETEYRARIDETLNELQTAVLLLAQLEANLTRLSTSVKELSYKVEEYINSQNAE